MKPGLDTLLAALDAARAPVSFFLRDDDGGWDDTALFALLDHTERAGVPIDLALIPQASGAALATSLGMRAAAAPGLIGLHQHGCAHTNHESTGRKCEFGDARPVAAQRNDLRAGRDRLRDRFGARLDAIFTPPWNRCSAATPALLVELGFEMLSRSRGAPAQHALCEVPVDVDWCKERRVALQHGDDGLERIALALAQRVAAGGPVGLMLHHAEMNVHDRALLDTLLGATRSHPRAHWQPMRDLRVGTLVEEKT
jgi:hypothetical protein